MRTDLEQRLATTLKAVAEQTPTPHDWDRVVADATRSSPGGRHRQAWGAPAMATAAVVLALAGLGLTLWTAVRDKPVTVAAGLDFVLPGETVVSEDPLVVVSAPGPDPAFDTSALGTEVRFEVIDEVDDEIQAMADRYGWVGPGASPDVSPTKVTLLGRVAGRPWIIIVRDGPNVDQVAGRPPNENLRQRFVTGPDGGRSNGAVVPADSLDLIALPSVDRLSISGEPGYDMPTGWLDWGPLPAAVSVVAFADSDQQLWMRPRAGTVVFPAQFDDGEPFSLRAFDADGATIVSYTGIASYGDDAAGTNPKIGENVGTVQGTDQDGRPISIEPDGRLTALIFGASWCQPCQAGIGPARQAIEDLGPGIRIYSVPHYSDEPWPIDANWPYPQLTPEPESPIKAIGELPAVVLLDGDNSIILVQIGFDGLADALQALNIDSATTTHTDPDAGISITYPPSWQLSTNDLTPNAGLSFRFALSTYPAPVGRDGGCAHLPMAALNALGSADAFVHLEERGPVATTTGLAPRPESFAAELNGIDNGEASRCADNPSIGTLRWIDFYENGRQFYLLIAIGDQAPDSLVARTAAALDSLKIESTS